MKNTLDIKKIIEDEIKKKILSNCIKLMPAVLNAKKLDEINMFRLFCYIKKREMHLENLKYTTLER